MEHIFSKAAYAALLKMFSIVYVYLTHFRNDKENSSLEEHQKCPKGFLYANQMSKKCLRGFAEANQMSWKCQKGFPLANQMSWKYPKGFL